MIKDRLAGALAALAFAALAMPAAQAGDPAVLYKNPQCGCCAEYGRYLEAHGYALEVEETGDMDVIKRIAGVPPELGSCHTLMIDGYVVEGHVPVEALARLLEERPDIRGIALPGMPLGSPGMSGAKEGPFTIYEISEEREVFAVE